MQNCRCIADEKADVAQPSVRQAVIRDSGAGRHCSTSACPYNMSEMRNETVQCRMHPLQGCSVHAARGRGVAEGLA